MTTPDHTLRSLIKALRPTVPNLTVAFMDDGDGFVRGSETVQPRL